MSDTLDGVVAERSTSFRWTSDSVSEAAHSEFSVVPTPNVGEHTICICFGRDNQDAFPKAQVLSIADLADRFSTPDTSRGQLPSARYHALNKNDPHEKKIRDDEKN